MTHRVRSRSSRHHLQMHLSSVSEKKTGRHMNADCNCNDLEWIHRQERQQGNVVRVIEKKELYAQQQTRTQQARKTLLAMLTVLRRSGVRGACWGRGCWPWQCLECASLPGPRAPCPRCLTRSQRRQPRRRTASNASERKTVCSSTSEAEVGPHGVAPEAQGCMTVDMEGHGSPRVPLLPPDHQRAKCPGK
jgi:hypothetical protein